jgi:hypothetical protein
MTKESKKNKPKPSPKIIKKGMNESKLPKFKNPPPPPPKKKNK